MTSILAKKLIEENKSTFDSFDMEVSKLVTAMFFQIPGSVFVSTYEGIIKVVNDESVLDYGRYELIGKNALELGIWVNPQERADVLKYVEEHRVLNNRQALFRKKDGSVIWGNFSASKKTINGKKYLIFNLQDISEKVRLEKDLCLALDKAEAANRAKSDFLANISHELRNPINAIELAIQLAKDVLQTDPAKAAEYLQMAQTKAANLREISTNVLDFFKLEQNTIEVNRESFALPELLNELRSYELTAKNNAIGFAIICEPDIPTQLSGDVQKLRQILINLLNNAFKFTSRGQVKLMITPEERTAEKICLKFQVIDTGIGIAAEDLPKLFKVFTQLDSSYTKKYQGSGLGLSIVKKMVDALGGKITVDSRPGQGSTFNFVLEFDIVAEAAQLTIDQQTGLSWPATDLRILVVEDDAINQIMLCDTLRRQKYQVAEAYDGWGALSLLKDNKYDLILMDVQMTELDGFQTTKMIREDATNLNQSTPVIFTTGYSGEREQNIMKELGGHVLYKPLDMYKLSTLLVEMFSTEKVLEKHAE